MKEDARKLSDWRRSFSQKIENSRKKAGKTSFPSPSARSHSRKSRGESVNRVMHMQQKIGKRKDERLP